MGLDGETTTKEVAMKFHSTATHVDAMGMPVAGVDRKFPFYPTPCCGASASINDGPMYCKACYREVEDIYGGAPVKPFRLIAEVER